MTRVFFESGAEMVVGPILLGDDSSRGRSGSGADLSEYRSFNTETTRYLDCLNNS